MYFFPQPHTIHSSLLPFSSREVPEGQRHLYGATKYGTPKPHQKRRDNLAKGITAANALAARAQITLEIIEERCKAAVEREKAAWVAGAITAADKDAAKALEPMFQLLKKGGGYKPRYSSKPCSETRWPTSAIDIHLQRKADGKDERGNWRGLSMTWIVTYNKRRRC
jgi:hypothetical protein